MLEVHIDGKSIRAEAGEYILAVAKRNGIPIPTLCHHSAIAGLGSCRLCIVEVDEGSGRKVVASCVYPLKRGCEIVTQSEKIIRHRRLIISMLRDRAPQAAFLQRLCDEYAVPDTGGRYGLPSNCVLCGRCAAACAVLGNGAISTVGRGTAKKVSTPYDTHSDDCIGCGTCARVCPVEAIECIETRDTRTIWNKTFRLIPCERCGTAFTTKEILDRVREKALAGVNLALCPDCRRKAVLQGPR
jgi:NADH dehydrogenase/NADH:ubiquinone oxidoreductase subunit G